VFQHRQPLKRYSRNGFLILTCHIIRANSNKVRGYKKNVNLSSSWRSQLIFCVMVH